jgi:hypothetical protein
MTIALEIPTTGIAAFVAQLAHLHEVAYVQTSNDALADLITRLSDDDVITDATTQTV